MSIAPDAAEVEMIEGRLMMLPVEQRLELIQRLMAGNWMVPRARAPIDQLLDYLRELADTTNRLPLNRELEVLPFLRGQNVSYLLSKLRRRGAIEISFPERDKSVRLFKVAC